MDQNSAPIDSTVNTSSETTSPEVSAVPPVQVSTNQELTLKEKYFQIEPEGRIRRYQYFVRSLVPGILLFFIIIASTILTIPLMMILGKASAIIGLVVMGGIYWLLYNLAKVNSIKRARDFGSDGKIAVYIVTASFAMSVIWLVVGVLQNFGVLPSVDLSAALNNIDATSSDNPMMAMKAIQSATPLYQRLLGYIGNIISIASTIMWLVLLFRPGVTGDNQYGKDPAARKVSFLG
ncbi:MAG: hypothetical protein HHAS10_10250 [Candidatus Altimarinota bacterium]